MTTSPDDISATPQAPKAKKERKKPLELSDDDVKRFVALFLAGPEAFKQALSEWREQHPEKTLRLGVIFAKIPHPDLSAYEPEDFNKMNLGGLDLNTARLPAEPERFIAELTRRRAAYNPDTAKAVEAVEEPQAAPTLTVDTWELRPLQKALEGKDGAAAVKACLTALRDKRTSPDQIVEIGRITSYNPNFKGLSERDFESLSMRGACLLNPVLPSEGFKKFLTDQGAILCGKNITVDESVPAPAAKVRRSR